MHALYSHATLYFLIGLLCLNCTSDSAGSSNENEHKYILTLDEDTLMVDSVHADVWFEEQLDKNMVTLKIYVTSSYLLEDKSVLGENGYMRISAQAVAEPGTHFINDSRRSRNNQLAYEFPHSSNIAHAKKNSIYIPTIDFDSHTLTCKVNIGAYSPLELRMQNKADTRMVVFYGEDIPFSVE